MAQKTRVNITMRPGDLAMLDVLAEFNGLSRGQMIESLTRAEARTVSDAWGGAVKQALEDAAALTSGEGVTR